MSIAFEVRTPLGFNVRVTGHYWELIPTAKHPAVRRREQDVRRAIGERDEVGHSRRDPALYLFYWLERPGRWVCAVARRLDGDLQDSHCRRRDWNLIDMVV